MDPRRAGIDRRLAEVRRIVAVTGGKGGIGKSLVSSALALVLGEAGLRTGLLDLDLTAPTDHVILGLDPRFPAEEFGVEPASVGGLRFMSIACFGGEAVAPLRGPDLTNALVELLAITRWQSLDALVIDMPPGLGDAALDLVRLLGRAEHLVLATTSHVVLETVRRNLDLLSRVEADVAGMIENMKRDDSPAARRLAERFHVPFLGTLPFDPGVERALGDPRRLVRTALGEGLRECAGKLFPELA